MLRTSLIHPHILETLGSAGHGSLILISDGNYPSLTAPNPAARRVYLNLRPGLISVTEILAALLPMIPIERIAFMAPDDDGHPAVQEELLSIVRPGTPAAHLSRYDFYAATRSPDLALVIVSGDRRWWANVLLTIGPIPEDATDFGDRPGARLLPVHSKEQ
jgi:L-fucose mutarotase